MARDKYVNFTEIEDVLSSLEVLDLVLPLTDKQPTCWKWAIMSAHAAFQGAMVCSLECHSSLSVLSENSAKEVLQWHENQSGDYPDEWMASFGMLLRRCTKDGPDDQRLILTEQQRKDITRLNDEFRNTFVHYKPASWSIEIAGLPRIVRAAVDGTEWLMHQETLRYKITENQLNRLALHLGRIWTTLDLLESSS